MSPADESPFISGRLFLVDLPFACFGLVVRHGHVVAAPPIARWMIGKGGLAVDRYIRSKGGTIVEVYDRG